MFGLLWSGLCGCLCLWLGLCSGTRRTIGWGHVSSYAKVPLVASDTHLRIGIRSSLVRLRGGDVSTSTSTTSPIATVTTVENGTTVVGDDTLHDHDHDHDVRCEQDDNDEGWLDTTATVTTTVASDYTDNEIYVTKRDGSTEPLQAKKILKRLRTLCSDLNCRYVDVEELASSILKGTYQNVTSTEIDVLASETAASCSTRHPDYGRLAARICASHNHKCTLPSFSAFVESFASKGVLDRRLVEVVRRHGPEIDRRIVHERDLSKFSYFGFKTLERTYLLKCPTTGRIAERPQYMWMRVALGIHCCRGDGDGDVDVNDVDGDVNVDLEQELRDLREAFETYELMSRGYFTHASPTLFHAGTVGPQLSSCFLVRMSEDSIEGIYRTLGECAAISKAAGGVGLSVHNIRARGTPIVGTRGTSNGLVPMLRVYDVTSRYVDQGGGKRPGAFAVYLEPWHSDVFDVLNLKKNHGKEEQRARNLFYGMWIPDLFMRRVEADEHWSLFCPHQCPGLQERWGADFERLYTQYEEDGRAVRTVRARELWTAILDAQIETGTPYMLYKDACNRKSNQRNLGTIQCSNLCTEIIQYSDKDEVAVCNLASICLPKFVVCPQRRSPHGSVDPEVSTSSLSSSSSSSSSTAYFDHEELHRIVKVVVRNLNKVIDLNRYPTASARRSNLRHRPMGIGVSGLADAFLRLGLPFDSYEARRLNEAIFETLYHAALEASADLASSEEGGSGGEGSSGAYETFEGSPMSEGQFQFNLWGMSNDDTFSRRTHGGRRRGPSPQREGGDEDDEDNDGHTHHEDDRVGPPMRYAPEHRDGYDWSALRTRIAGDCDGDGPQTKGCGLRNSLLIAPMPTASTSQILGVNECFEPFVSNLYVRRVKAGEFIMANPHLLQDLVDLGLWDSSTKNRLMADGGSVRSLDRLPDRYRKLYQTAWEMSMRDVVRMAADRAAYVDQSQSLNLFVADPDHDKLTAMHFYAWKRGLKTGMYYLRTRPAVQAIQYTVEKPPQPSPQPLRDDDDHDDDDDTASNGSEDPHGDIQLQRSSVCIVDDDGGCLSCSA